ncbi:hypothetical protein DMENIID0001_041640 [Sergentomyia squamirostris]
MAAEASQPTERNVDQSQMAGPSTSNQYDINYPKLKPKNIYENLSEDDEISISDIEESFWTDPSPPRRGRGKGRKRRVSLDHEVEKDETWFRWAENYDKRNVGKNARESSPQPGPSRRKTHVPEVGLSFAWKAFLLRLLSQWGVEDSTLAFLEQFVFPCIETLIRKICPAIFNNNHGK